MNVLKKRLPIGLAAAATMAAAITWVSASGMVVLYPATISGTLTLSSEPVTSIKTDLYLATGGSRITKTTAVTAPGPYSFQLTVDGGNPSDPSDPGVSYRPFYLYAYLQNSTAQETYLRIYRTSTIVVDNTAEDPSVTVPVSFNYPTTYRSNASISIIGGKINAYYLYTSASNSTANESYFGQTTSSYSGTSAPASITSWAPMVPNSSVRVYGTVYVTDDQGQTSQRSLATQLVDMSAGGANVSWTVDLTNTGSLEGDIALVASADTAPPTSYAVVYRGTSASTSGISGSVSVSASSPHYSVTLTPGQYDVYLQTSFSDPSQRSETPRTAVTLTAGATTIKDFTDSLGVGRIALSVDGFYSTSTLHAATSFLRGPGYSYIAQTSQNSATGFDHTVPVGTWQSYFTLLHTYDQSNPDLPNDNYLIRDHYTDASMPPASVTASDVASLGTESFTLVKSNVYFDVAELAGQAEVNVSNPQIYAYRWEYNADNTLRRRNSVNSYGSSTARPVSGLTMVAEPGMYVLDAMATVNGTLTRFAGSTIWFGEPVATPPGDSTVVLTPEQNLSLSLSLDFEQVTAGGITTVVESPLGPAPPEGFRSVCIENADGVNCDPVYYDISSTAQWTGSTKVCVRRQFPGVVNAAADFMSLYHYNETTAAWEELPPPPDGVRAFDCSADPAVCGCADEASCGIDPSSDPVRNVFLLCGMTTSFSPFAVFQGKRQFTNKVNGVEYTGPTGPPGLQSWEVPGNGTYRITAVGAQGANASNSSLEGGCGAEVTGDFVLQAGDVVQILVGQKGTAAPNSGGGGGGTFVVKNGSPLLIAGGGGGVRAGALVDGRPGTQSTGGTAGSTSSNYTGGFVAGGTNGGGGSSVLGYGSGGGGWSGNGASDGTYGEGGFAFLGANQARGGAGQSCGAFASGGYGGGGAGNGCYGGGGGGGYSGGGGGRVGGGGGSLNTGANQSGEEGQCTPTGHGHGIVKIDLIGP